MILDLVDYRSPVLRNPSDPVEDFSTAEKLAVDLIETMRAHRGLGLSACQVGIPLRAFALRSEPDAVLFNLRIVDVSEEVVALEEGCLSIPGLFARVKRPSVIKCRFHLMDGDVRTMKFSGMTSRTIQHELDHLDGKLFTSRLSRLNLERAIKRAEKSGHRYLLGDLR